MVPPAGSLPAALGNLPAAVDKLLEALGNLPAASRQPALEEKSISSFIFC